MLTVDDYDRIRREVLIEGKSQREVARELGHSRNTVKKALEYSSPPNSTLSNLQCCLKSIIHRLKNKKTSLAPPERDVIMVIDQKNHH